jgi:hypothetical protein
MSTLLSTGGVPTATPFKIDRPIDSSFAHFRIHCRSLSRIPYADGQEAALAAGATVAYRSM